MDIIDASFELVAKEMQARESFMRWWRLKHIFESFLFLLLADTRRNRTRTRINGIFIFHKSMAIDHIASRSPACAHHIFCLECAALCCRNRKRAAKLQPLHSFSMHANKFLPILNKRQRQSALLC